jgi:hypothetical protein
LSRGSTERPPVHLDPRHRATFCAPGTPSLWFLDSGSHSCTSAVSFVGLGLGHALKIEY